MRPPQLSADTPVAFSGKPLQVRVAVAHRVRMKGHLAASRGAPGALCCLHSRLGQSWRHKFVSCATAADHTSLDVAHLHKPLLGEIRLDGRLRTIGMANFYGALFPGLPPGLGAPGLAPPPP